MATPTSLSRDEWLSRRPVRRRRTAGKRAPAIAGVPTLARDIEGVITEIEGTADLGEDLIAIAAPFSGSGYPMAVTWQWTRDGVDIAAATAQVYTLVSADIGTDVAVVQTVTDSKGRESSATSAAVVVIDPS